MDEGEKEYAASSQSLQCFLSLSNHGQTTDDWFASSTISKPQLDSQSKHL